MVELIDLKELEGLAETMFKGKTDFCGSQLQAILGLTIESMGETVFLQSSDAKCSVQNLLGEAISIPWF